MASSLLEKEDESSLASASSPLTGVWRWGLFKLSRPHCPLKGANKSGHHTHVLGGRSSHRGAWLGLAPATTPPQLPPKAEWGGGGRAGRPSAFAEAFGLVFGCRSPWGRLHPTRELYFSICLAERRRHFRLAGPRASERPLAPGSSLQGWPARDLKLETGGSAQAVYSPRGPGAQR